MDEAEAAAALARMRAKPSTDERIRRMQEAVIELADDFDRVKAVVEGSQLSHRSGPSAGSRRGRDQAR